MELMEGNEETLSRDRDWAECLTAVGEAGVHQRSPVHFLIIHVPAKKSDLTAQDRNSLLSALAIVESTLDESDEELPSELISSLEKLRAKLEVVQACILII